MVKGLLVVLEQQLQRNCPLGVKVIRAQLLLFHKEVYT